jgi:hypothetical protein
MDTGSPVRRTSPFPVVSALHSRSRPPFSHAAFSHSSCSAPPLPQGQVQRASAAQWTRPLSANSSSAARPRLRRTPSRHASHARHSPSRSDPTSSSGRLQLQKACLRSAESVWRILTPATHLHSAPDSSSTVQPCARTGGRCPYRLGASSFLPLLPSYSCSPPPSLSSLGPRLTHTTRPFPVL